MAHLMRDVATGGGAAILWPLTSDGLRIPFWVEAAALAALAVRGWQHAGRLPILRSERERRDPVPPTSRC